MKSRVVIWAVIVVVAAGLAVLIVRIMRAPRTGTVTVQGVDREVARLSRNVDKLAAELTRLRALPAAANAADSLTVVEGLLNSARAQADTIRAAADAGEANARLQRTRDEMLDPARGIMKRVERRLTAAPAPPQ